MTAAPLFTVLTPAFNRAWTLPGLKDSLDRQEFRDFEWLVVDDGSADGTEALIGEWAGTSSYVMRLLSGPNGGKHRALNRGIPEARGRWIFIVDSDDRLPPDSLALIAALVPEADRDPSIGGIMGLRCDPEGTAIGEDFPPGLVRADAAALTFRDGLRGDKAEVFKADVLRRFPFPEFPGEKFITECVVWFRIAAAGYDLLILPAPIYICEYRSDGLSARSLALRIANPAGTQLFYREELALPYPLRSLFREAVNLVRFRVHGLLAARSLPRFGRLPARALFLIVLASPVGMAAALADLLQILRQKFRKKSGA